MLTPKEQVILFLKEQKASLLSYRELIIEKILNIDYKYTYRPGYSRSQEFEDDYALVYEALDSIQLLLHKNQEIMNDITDPLESRTLFSAKTRLQKISDLQGKVGDFVEGQFKLWEKILGKTLKFFGAKSQHEFLPNTVRIFLAADKAQSLLQNALTPQTRLCGLDSIHSISQTVIASEERFEHVMRQYSDNISQLIDLMPEKETGQFLKASCEQTDTDSSERHTAPTKKDKSLTADEKNSVREIIQKFQKIISRPDDTKPS